MMRKAILFASVAIIALSTVAAASNVQIQQSGSALWTEATDVVLEDGLAFCAMEYGLQIVDVSEAGSPTIVSRTLLTSGGEPYELVVEGGYAYLARAADGLQIVDVSQPGSPVFVGQVKTSNRATGLVVNGDFAYVADLFSGLQVIDISDRTNPAIVGSVDTPERARGIDYSAGYVFVADGTGGLAIFDVSNPSAPTHVFTYDSIQGSVYDVSVQGTMAYLACWGAGLLILDITDPSNPVHVSQLPQDSSISSWRFLRIHVASQRAFLTGYYQDGLHIVDVSDPLAPQLLGMFQTPGYMRSASASDFVAVAADSRQGLYIIDVSDPTAPIQTGHLKAKRGVLKVRTSGDYAYIAHSEEGFNVIDISDPTSMLRVAGDDLVGFTGAVAVSDNYLLIGDEDTGDPLWKGALHAYDISDPTSPSFVSTTLMWQEVLDIEIYGDWVYLAHDIYGLQVVDFRNPSNPIRQYHFGLYGSKSTDLAMGNGLLFVSDDNDGFRIFDLADPEFPELLASFATAGTAVGIAVSGTSVYVASVRDGLHILDVTDPTVPVLMSTFTGMGLERARGVTIASGLAYVSHGSEGVFIVDVSDPTNPSLAGHYDSPGVRGFSSDVAVVGDIVFVADDVGFLALSTIVSRGDVNADGVINSADIIHLVNFVFKSGTAPQPLVAAGDVNCSQSVNASDIIYEVNYVFKGGPAPLESCGG